MDRVPQPAQVEDRVGKVKRDPFRVLGSIGGVCHHALETADRESEGGDIVMIEDARGHQGAQGLATPIGQKGNLAGQVGRQLVEGPAESIEPSQDPFQSLLVLAADLLGDDPVLAGRPDIVEVAFHQRLGGDARAGRWAAADPGIPRRNEPAARAIP